jgi:hypothetical protein
MDNYLFDNIDEIGWLKIIHSYINHQIDPQPSIPLDYLESLHVTDINAITPDMFEIYKYEKEQVERMLQALSIIIYKKEKEKYGKTSE